MNNISSTSLFVSGDGTVLSTLNVSGNSRVNSTTTLNSSLNVSGSTLLRSTLNVSSTATLNNLTVNGTITGTNFNKTLVGLSNVANTSPSGLPISTATQSALDGKLSNITNSSILEQVSTLTFIHNNALQMSVGNTTSAQLMMDMNPTNGVGIYTNANLNYNLTVGSTLTVLGSVLASNNITANSIFVRGGGININSTDTLNINGGINGVNLWCNSNTLAYFNTVGITMAYDTKILQAKTTDNILALQNTTGTSSLALFGNLNKGSRITQNTDGNLNFSVNVSGTSILPLSIYSNGVINCNASSATNNKQLVLFESAAADTPSTATNFFGLGINSQTLRYQAAQTTHTHKFYCGSTLGFTITNTGGSPTSDLRFKSNINNINNALDKINQMQGKTFIMFNDDSKPQIGFIAQDLINVLPEVVVVDSSDDHYMSIQYDKITSLLNEGIKELYKEIQILKNRIDILENK